MNYEYAKEMWEKLIPIYDGDTKVNKENSKILENNFKTLK